jgi:putative endonuclease
MSNAYHNVFYVGVTSDLEGRIWQHKNGEGGVFTKKYNCDQLLYYEDYTHIEPAIAREKQLKKWRKAWKIELIKKENAELNDLAGKWYE